MSDGVVTLAPLCLNDVTDAYLSWLRDPDVIRFTEVYEPVDAMSLRAYIANTMAAPDAAMWRIEHESRHVGNIRLSGINCLHRRAAVALMIGEKAIWGRGVGSAAIDLLAKHAFSFLGLHKLAAGIYSVNVASRRAFEKAGFHREATLRDNALFEGSFIDVLLMARFAGAR